MTAAWIEKERRPFALDVPDWTSPCSLVRTVTPGGWTVAGPSNVREPPPGEAGALCTRWGLSRRDFDQSMTKQLSEIDCRLLSSAACAWIAMLVYDFWAADPSGELLAASA